MFDSEGLEIAQAAGDCQLAVVYSSDVAKFLASFILQPPNDKSIDVINLCCADLSHRAAHRVGTQYVSYPLWSYAHEQLSVVAGC